MHWENDAHPVGSKTRAEHFKRMYDVFNTGDVRASMTSLPTTIASWRSALIRESGGPERRSSTPASPQPAEMYAAALRFEPGEVQTYHEGSVGWVAESQVSYGSARMMRR